ncbi:MAG TPA: hypothetical protein VFA63_15000 [Pseudonocardiaceae bacterium]|nr:hypothetical protein [Pseudonocardiaceae bacterium]
MSLAASHREQYHWRLVWPGHSLNEPEHDVSIREAGRDAVALQVVDAMGRPQRSVDLRGGWRPVWYRCHGFGREATRSVCIVYGRAKPLDNYVQVEIESIYRGRFRDYVEDRFIDRLAIATQTLKVKG